ncbi:MAG: hypothetical protein PHU85_04340 [Phycisphaerae bacterium]|nr:hypothetical protein [Phycisphaerae bacterium]
MARWSYTLVVLLIAAAAGLLLGPSASAQPTPQPLVGQILYVGQNLVSIRPLPPGWVTRVNVSTDSNTRVFVDGYVASMNALKPDMIAEIYPGVGLAKVIRATSPPE